MAVAGDDAEAGACLLQADSPAGCSDSAGDPYAESLQRQGLYRWRSSWLSRGALLSAALLACAAAGGTGVRSAASARFRLDAVARYFDLPFKFAWPWDQEAVHPNIAKEGPTTMSFYMYRAGGESFYPLENVNTASLEGVMWYLHNEVVASTPRKYGIDRIRRFKVQVHNTQEFFNVHKRQFGPFFAFDAGKCTTKATTADGESICDKTYHQYGFLVGCQTVSLENFRYLAPAPTTTACEPGSDACRAGLWFSLPGECPSMGIPQESIKANAALQNVDKYKTFNCRVRSPGGQCDQATGAPDCTYSVEEAGEVFLDDLAGIENYNFWWNASFTQCNKDLEAGIRADACEKHLEYSFELDRGVGTDFWDARGDEGRCLGRVQKALSLFTQKYSTMDARMDPPACDFDQFYEDEFTWPINHDGAGSSEYWSYSSGGPVSEALKQKFRTPAPKAVFQPGPDKVH